MIVVVIAAYNEQKTIKSVVRGLENKGYSNIVVVDDASIDDTCTVAEKLRVHLLRHPINLGQGASLRTGITYALEIGANFIVTYDADGQHNPDDIKNLLKPLKSGKFDVTLGSRFIKRNAKIPFTRKVILKIAINIQWFFYGIRLTDAHNGLRCLSRRAAQKINFKSNRMEHASEIIEEIKRNKLRYVEVPVKINYTKETMEKGHGGLGQAFVVFLKLILNKLLR